MKAKITLSLLVGFVMGALMIPSAALAGPYVPVANPVPPQLGPGPPFGPEVHPGKEYSHELDKNAAGALDPLQNINWDGSGGVQDTFDYGDPPYFPPIPDGVGPIHNNFVNNFVGSFPYRDDDQVDAIANVGDALFFPVATNNTAPILFSTRLGPHPPGPDFDTVGPGFNAVGPGVDAGAPGCGVNPVCYETTGGAIGTWATWPQVDQHGVDNLDGLEVWGPEPGDDANKFSLVGDFITGVSVWTIVGGGPAKPYITTAQIAALLGEPEELIDIDAMMVQDIVGAPDIWDPGDWLMFSLWDTAFNPFIGDEVWVWQNAGFFGPLNHGGHLWTSGWLGLNVDALEAGSAVPEPATLLLFGTGLAGLGFVRRRS